MKKSCFHHRTRGDDENIVHFFKVYHILLTRIAVCIEYYLELYTVHYHSHIPGRSRFLAVLSGEANE